MKRTTEDQKNLPMVGKLKHGGYAKNSRYYQ
jgi:hypothetical protein